MPYLTQTIHWCICEGHTVLSLKETDPWLDTHNSPHLLKLDNLSSPAKPGSQACKQVIPIIVQPDTALNECQTGTATVFPIS